MQIFQASVSLLLKKINDDLEYLKESLDIVRENPQFMANELLSSAIQKLDGGQFNEVWIWVKNLVSSYIYRQ